MEDGKTLSKNLIYTPLEAYYNAGVTTGVNDEAHQKKIKTSGNEKNAASNVDHPADYMKQKSVVSKTIHESSLVSFIQVISQDYHRNRATANEPKNNGCRPLSLPDMEERIRQRAVTIVGGGINSSIPISSTNILKKQYEIIKSKKRRQRSWEAVKSILTTISSPEEEQNQQTSSDITFLKKLNSTWNQYMWKLLNLKSFDLVDAVVIKRQLSSILNDDNLEFVGAHVQIESCTSQHSWIGRFGILIGETKNTYRMVGIARNNTNKRRKKSSQGDTKKKSDDDDDDEPKPIGMAIETFLVPKQGSSFLLIIPAPEEGGNDSTQEFTIADLSLVEIPENSLAISLTPSD
jgi:hypothetical protein